MRHYTWIDNILVNIDEKFFQTVQEVSSCDQDPTIQQPLAPNKTLTACERNLSASLMRINHAGEIAAQGLYRGQSLTAKLDPVRAAMLAAAEEEALHLEWCRHRVVALGSRTSILGPIWYAGAFCMGTFAGLIGDKWSLGLVAETEIQVSKHLQSHLQRLPRNDLISRDIVTKMLLDEQRHAVNAQAAGANELPSVVKRGMRGMAKVMTTLAFWI